MGGLFSKPDVPEPPPAPEPREPKKKTEEISKKAEAEERARLRKMEGRKSTILTGGQGVTEDPSVKIKSLLGG